MKRVCPLGCLVLTALLLSPTVARAQVDDQVYGAGGAPTRGTITEMSPDVVKIDTAGGPREIPVNEIRKIQYAGEMGELRSARDKAARGQLEDALEELNKIPAEIDRAVVKQDVEFYKAYCMSRLALTSGKDKAAAVTAMLNFAKNSPGNYHFYEAAEVLGDLALAMGIPNEALKYYGALGKAPWPEYKMRSSVLEAESLVVQKSFDAALTKYDEVIAMGLSTADANRQKLFAQVGKAACLAETGKPDQGIPILNTIIAENDHKNEPELFARAYNAQGACYRKLNEPKKALHAYLHVDLLFRRGDPDAHAEALFYLAQLWAAVNKSERAVEARTLLNEAYPGSRWIQ